VARRVRHHHLVPLVAMLGLGCRHTLVVGSDAPDAGAPGPASLATGLVGYWKLDDPPGSPRAHDSSVQANDAIPEAVSTTDWLAAGRIGGALAFGNAGWLRGTDAAGVNTINGGLSIAAWILLGDREDREQVILQRQLGTSGAAHFLLSLRLGRPALSGAALPRCEGPPLPTNAWVHLTASYDGSTERLFVDGIQVAGCPASGTFAADATSVTVGGGQNSADPFDVDRRLRAILDEVVLYARALSPDEVTALAAGFVSPVP
jgi:hypothetical protein